MGFLSVSSFYFVQVLTYSRPLGFPFEASIGSPLEAVFWYEFRKVAAEAALVTTQAECFCPDGQRVFFLDFLISCHSRDIGIECDGFDYHQDRKKDAFRDAQIIQAGFAHRIFRLRGYYIYHQIHDLFGLLEKMEPVIFSARGSEMIAQRSDRRFTDEFIWNEPKRKGWVVDFPGIAVRHFERVEDSEETEDEASDDSPIVMRFSGEEWKKREKEASDQIRKGEYQT